MLEHAVQLAQMRIGNSDGFGSSQQSSGEVSCRPGLCGAAKTLALERCKNVLRKEFGCLQIEAAPPPTSASFVWLP